VHKFPEKISKMKVVLSHDWLTGMRGGERVLEILCAAFPGAPLFTLIHNQRTVSDVINSHGIRTSWLQHVPGIMKNYRLFLPLFPDAIEGMNAPEADLMISTSHCVAKGLRPHPGTKHLCYCFTPMRYAWTFHEEYFGGRPLMAMLAKPVLSALRNWDKSTSVRVDRFVAISRHVQKRIMDFYGRESDVVYPPVDTGKWTPADRRSGDFDLVVSALVPYKRIDLAIRAYNQLAFPLKIVGVGTEMKKLRSMANPNIEFLEWQPDEKILDLYRNSRLLVFPGEEDFGIVPPEAQACGTPVVAYAKGGVLETVKEGVSGTFFKEQTVESLLDGVKRCISMSFDPGAIRANAEQFGTMNFINGLSESIEKCMRQPKAK